jgi:hypothetical protein
MPGRRGRLFHEDITNDDGIVVGAVNDSPTRTLVNDTQFVAGSTDRRHGPAVGHSQRLAALQPAKQHSCINTRRRRKWRRLNLASEPYQRSIFVVTQLIVYCGFKLCQI